MNEQIDTQLLMDLELAGRKAKENEEKLEVVDKQLSELEAFNVYLKEISESEEKEILASVGKGVYLRADMRKDKLLVDVGSGVLVKKDSEETKTILKDQTQKLHEMKIQLLGEQESLRNEIEVLSKKAQM